MDNLCLHNLKIRTTKMNLHRKYIAPIVTELIIPSQLVKKNTEMTQTKEKPMLDQNRLNNQLYSTFVLPRMIEQNAMIHDTEVEVHHGIILTTYTIIHKTDIVLHIEIDLVIPKVVPLHTTLDHDLTTTKETRDLLALFVDPHKDHLTDVTLVADIIRLIFKR